MSRLGIIILTLFCGLSQLKAMSFFDGLLQYANYQSSLPCKSKSNKDCQSKQGLMGLVLDQASEAGLNISTIMEKQGSKQMPPQVFVTTEKFGTCRVETRKSQSLGLVSFICSSNGLNGNKLESVDRVFTLIKEDQQYALLDITHSAQLKSGL